MARQKILFLMQLPPPIHGVSAINQRLVRSKSIGLKFESSVIPMRFSDSIDDIDKFSFKKLLVTLNIALRLSWECIINRPDLVYFTFSPVGAAFYRDLIYVAILKALWVNRVFHLHRLGVRKSGERWLKGRLYRWAFGGAWIIHLTPRLYEDIEPYVQREKCYFVSNTADDPYGAAEFSAPQHRDGVVNFAFLSHMVVEKGPIVMLESLVELKHRGIKFRATFAGGRMSRECEKSFSEILTRYGLSNEVSYLGPVYGTEKEAFYRDADVFIFPSLYDSFGIVLLEAMSYGIPIIATNQGGIPDVVQDGETGFLVNKNNPSQLADRMAVLANNSELRARFGTRGRKRFEEKYTVDVFERKMVNALDRCARNVINDNDNYC
jgi:glycosyltransferase involved in cell wall biosynthesis